MGIRKGAEHMNYTAERKRLDHEVEQAITRLALSPETLEFAGKVKIEPDRFPSHIDRKHAHPYKEGLRVYVPGKAACCAGDLLDKYCTPADSAELNLTFTVGACTYTVRNTPYALLQFRKRIKHLGRGIRPQRVAKTLNR